MYSVSFHGGETCGSVGKLNTSQYISFMKGETCGSVGKTPVNTVIKEGCPLDSEPNSSLSKGETCGSVGKITSSVAFKKGETCGSVGKLRFNSYDDDTIITKSSDGDTLTFKSKYVNGNSSGITTALTAFSAAAMIAGLGYVHKANLVDKLNDGKLKDFARKTDIITKPCHTLCSSIKKNCSKMYNKIFK